MDGDCFSKKNWFDVGNHLRYVDGPRYGNSSTDRDSLGYHPKGVYNFRDG